MERYVVLLNTPPTQILLYVLAYFSKFGDVAQVILSDDGKVSTGFKWGFVMFSEPTGAAKALQEANHQLQSKQIFVQACGTWNQPKTQQIEYEATNESSLLQLNDDCLEYIFKILPREDQLQLGLVCPRLRDVFQMACKSKYKVLCYDQHIGSFEERDFFELVGPIIETMHHCKRSHMLIAKFCPNLKSVSFENQVKRLPYLHKFLGKLKHLTKLELKYCFLNDDDILAIAKLTNLESILLSENRLLKGQHLDKLISVKSLGLYRCSKIDSTYFISMCKSLKELKSLDIRSCRLLVTTAINEMVSHCHKLEILKMTRAEDCVAHLPKLKSLHIFDYVEQSFIVALAEHAQQLEYLRIDDENGVIDDIAVLIARLKNLKQLTWGCYWARPENLKISKCVSNLSNLKSVQIGTNKPLGHQLFVALAEHLILCSAQWITYDIVVLIAGLKRLKKLVCNQNKALDDKCLRKLVELKNLERIDVCVCESFTNEGLLFLLSKCTKLRYLSVQYCHQITDTFVAKAAEVLNQRQEQPKEQLLVYIHDSAISNISETPTLKLSLSDSADDSMDDSSLDSSDYDNVIAGQEHVSEDPDSDW